MRHLLARLIVGSGSDPTFQRDFERFSRFWFAGVVLIYLLIGILGSTALWKSKQAASIRHEMHIIDTATAAAPPGKDSYPVMAGVYLERIFDLSPRTSRWGADFYLWFRWKKAEGSAPDLDLSKIQLVDGEIVHKSEVRSLENQAGERYVLYRIEAVVTKNFDTTRFPQEDHVLTLRVENGNHQRDQLHFVAETTDSGLSSRVSIPGYRIYHDSIRERPHAYRSPRGQSSFHDTYAEANYSQLQYSIGIQRDGWELFLKVFQGIFVSVAIALMAFLVNPAYNSPRISLGVGALFAVVASSYVLSQYLPQGNSPIGLTDIITSLALVTIMLTLLTSTISLGLCTRRLDPAFVRRFDLRALATFGICFGAVNLGLALLVGM